MKLSQFVTLETNCDSFKLKVENGKLKVVVQTPSGFVLIIYRKEVGNYFIWGLTFGGWTYIIGAR